MDILRRHLVALACLTSVGALAQGLPAGKQIRIVASSEADGVAVRTEFPEIRGMRMKNLSYSVDMHITLPATAPLTARNRFGNTDVQGVHAASTIENKQGSIKFKDGRGVQTIGNSFGAVEVEGNRGNVTVSNSNGSVDVHDVEGTLSVTNRFGSQSPSSVSVRPPRTMYFPPYAATESAASVL